MRANKSMVKHSQILKSPSRSSVKISKKKNVSQSVNNNKIKNITKPLKLRFLKG